MIVVSTRYGHVNVEAKERAALALSTSDNTTQIAPNQVVTVLSSG